MERRKIIGFYDYTVVLTYLGLALAFFGIIHVLKGNYLPSIMCLMGAGICDMFDGAVAATKERNCYEKHFGIQIDSLCDLISFGLLPAIFVYRISGESWYIAALACVFTLCGLIRLAYYNVQEYERQQITAEKRETYLGVPITTSAIVLPLTYLLYVKVSFIGVYIFPIMTALLGIGYVAGVEIKKPKAIGKLVLIVIGLVEMLWVFLLSGADLL